MKVLLVDDEDDIRTFMRAALEGEGWEVAEAPDGEEGVRGFEEAAPDLVIMDYKMPGLTGLEACEKIRSLGFTGPIILFSGYLDSEMADQARELDITPVSKADIQAVFRAVGALAAELQP